MHFRDLVFHPFHFLGDTFLESSACTMPRGGVGHLTHRGGNVPIVPRYRTTRMMAMTAGCAQQRATSRRIVTLPLFDEYQTAVQATAKRKLEGH